MSLKFIMDLDIEAHMKSIEEMLSSCRVETPNVGHDSIVAEVAEVVDDMSRQTKEMNRMVSGLQLELKAAKDKLSDVEKRRLIAKKELRTLQEEQASISKKSRKLKASIEDCKAKIEQSLRKSTSDKEIQLLDKNQSELEAYQMLTGIRWSFNTPDNMKEGLVFNSQTNFVKPFEFEKNVPKKKVSKMLWTYMSESVAQDYWDE